MAALDPKPESGSECDNNTDDDGDGWVNEGCPRVGSESESGKDCKNDTNDDRVDDTSDDDKVNDGCPPYVPRWIFPPDTEEGKKLDLEGIYGRPAIGGDSVYFAAYDDSVYALDAKDGGERWHFRTGEPVVGAVTLTGDGRLYVGSRDAKLYVLDAKDGGELQHFTTDDEIWSAPLVADDAVYVATAGGRLYALDRNTLAPVWDKPFDGGAGLISDPVLTDEGTILVGGFGKTLYSVDKATGSQVWAFKAGNWFWGRPLVVNGTAYVPNLDRKVYALDVKTGEEKWQTPFQAEAPVRSSPLLADDILIVSDGHGNVYGLHPEDGTLVWSGPSLLGKTVLSDPLLLDDKVLIVAEGGDLFQIDPQVGTSTLVRVVK